MASSSQQSSSINPAISESTSSNPRSQRTSDVWNHFDIVEVVGVEKAICKVCKKYFSCKASAGTGHLRRHAQTHAPRESRQATLNTSGGDQGLAVFHFSQQKARELIIKWLIKEELPFTLCSTSRPAWGEMVTQGLQPSYIPVSRQTIVRDIIKIFNDYKAVLHENFKNISSKISLTSDIWTSSLYDSFMCINAHWIDEKWNLQKRIISFRRITSPHTGQAIALGIQQVVREFEIENKIQTISFDNASNNQVVVRLLKSAWSLPFNGKLFHIKCSCHILNLCVQDGLDYLSEYIHKIRNVVSHLRLPSNACEFRQFCEGYGKPYKRFPIDVRRRWNYTYCMLNSLTDYGEFITEFYNPRIRSEHSNLELNDYDWIVANVIRDFLKVFYNATVNFSGCYYSTTNIFLKEILEIAICFQEHRDQPFFTPICKEMEIKFLKYWESLPVLNFVVVVLDPRFKEEGTFLMLEQFVAIMNLQNKINVNQEKQKHSKFIEEMYAEYELKYGVARTPQTHTAHDTTKMSRKVWNILSKKSKGSSSSSGGGDESLSELNLYNKSDFVSYLSDDEKEHFNVLEFWKNNAKTWPVLAAMARDLLTPPMSTVPSECTFSASGRVLDAKRSCLTAEHVEMCVLLKDWLDAESQNQTRMAYDFSKDAFEDEVEQLMELTTREEV